MSASTYFPSIPKSIARALIQRDQRQKFIRSLRTTAYYGSLVCYDSTALADRCAVARLVEAADVVLRQLVNKNPKGDN